MAYTLFPYQQQAVQRSIESIVQGDNILVASPTGSGKSLMEITAMMRIERELGLQSGLITSRREIISGIIEKAGEMGFNLTNKCWTPARFWNALKNNRAKMPDVLLIDECLHPDTLVLTPSGPRPIGDLKAGDEVYTPYGTPTKVTKAWRTKKAAVRLRTSQGREVICSPDHKFLVPQGKGTFNGGDPRTGEFTKGETNSVQKCQPVGVPASELTHLYCAPADMMLAIGRGKRVVNPRNYLYGWVLGGGHVTLKGGAIQFSFTKDVDEFDDLLLVHMGFEKGRDFTRRTSCGRTVFYLRKHVSAPFVSEYQLPRGNKSQVCEIRSDLVNDVDVLRGLFDAEACRHADRISLDVASQKMAKQIQVGLHNLGIICTFNEFKRKTTDKEGNVHAPRFRLLICGENINRFNRVVGWGLKRKQQPHRKCWTKGAVYQADKIVEREEVGEIELVDITIEDEQHFFVLADGVLSSNCHHALAKTWKRLLQEKSHKGHEVRVVGFTATPMRGVEYENPPWKALFHQFYEAITITQAIREDRLTNFYLIKELVSTLGETELDSYKQQNEAAQETIMSKVDYIYDTLLQLDPSRPTVFICPTVPAAIKIGNYFTDRGIPVREMLGTTPVNTREYLLKELAKNNLWISAVNIMTEGVDVPEISRVVNLRPSVSPIPYVQGLGRGLRVVYDKYKRPDFTRKRYCEFADFTNNMHRFDYELQNVLGIKFKEGEHVYVPDLDYTVKEEHKMTIVPDYINFRWKKAEPTSIVCHFEGREVMARVGATTQNGWAIRLYSDNTNSSVYVLRAGVWRKRVASLQPVDYQIQIGETNDLVLDLAAKMGRGFQQVSDGSVRLGQLLTYSLLRQLVSEDRELNNEENEALVTSARFLKLIPTPTVLHEKY